MVLVYVNGPWWIAVIKCVWPVIIAVILKKSVKSFSNIVGISGNAFRMQLFLSVSGVLSHYTIFFI